MRQSLWVSALFAVAMGAAQASVAVYYTGLYGANECAGGTCGLGDPDGYGAATVMIDNTTNRVTWSSLGFNIVTPLTGAHIHNAPAGVAGPIIVDFGGQFAGNVVSPNAATITPATAANRYVNLHNSVYPAGAIRGQLIYASTVDAPAGSIVPLSPASTLGAIDIYMAALYGINEVGAGDSNGWGVATVMIDNQANTVTWSIIAYEIDAVTAAHIHIGAAGTNGPVRIDFSAMLAGTVPDSDAALITPGSAAGWYVNVHTAAFGGGAIRGQLMHVASIASTLATVPEPASVGLMLAALGALALTTTRRHRRRT